MKTLTINHIEKIKSRLRHVSACLSNAESEYLFVSNEEQKQYVDAELERQTMFFGRLIMEIMHEMEDEESKENIVKFSNKEKNNAAKSN